MVDQATLDRGGSPPRRVRHNLGELAHDAITLVELQVQLLAVDLRDARRGASAAVVQIAAGACLGIGAVPLLLLAGAQLLIDLLGWSSAGAYATAGILAVAIAGALLWAGWRQSVHAVATVQRSKTEFEETLRWLKGSLHPPAADEIDGPLSDDSRRWNR
jgi:hypothetical protein